MREIEFRAWLKDEKKMVEVISINTNDKLLDYIDNENKDLILGTSFDDAKLMQYVGLKDKNGKKIFEGDIVNNGENENLIVLWSDYYQSFIINEKIGLYGDQSDDRLYDCDDIIEEYEPFNYKCASYEVIGNCWENPELLEVE